VYSLDQVPGRFRLVAEANPLTGMMELIRYGFLGVSEVHWWAIAWSVAATVLAVLGGLWFFNRYAQVAARTGLDDDDEEALA
jgi:ABC-type polysaccharide/polyol phosphate export permease